MLLQKRCPPKFATPPPLQDYKTEDFISHELLEEFLRQRQHWEREKKQFGKESMEFVSCGSWPSVGMGMDRLGCSRGEDTRSGV